MARARNIKPAFFKNEVLAELPLEARILFIGLWTLADREGRLEDRPRRIKIEIFPLDTFDVDPMLDKLAEKGFLLRYAIGAAKYIQIVNFVKHQDPHYREKKSEIPPPNGHEDQIIASNVTRTQRARILERDNFKCQNCNSEEHLCIDHVLPVSRGGDSSDENLQVLCLSCNTKKGNKLSQFDDEPTLTRRSTETIPPDSLIPDSLIPDPLQKNMSAKADYPPGFLKFWEAWPNTTRKGGRPDSYKVWVKRKCETKADAIVSHVETMKATPDWRGGYEPMPTTYLNREQWDGADLSAPASGESPWFLNGWSSIVAKGAEFQLREDEFDDAPRFRAAVLKAAGITPDMVKKAEAMAK